MAQALLSAVGIARRAHRRRCLGPRERYLASHFLRHLLDVVMLRAMMMMFYLIGNGKGPRGRDDEHNVTGDYYRRSRRGAQAGVFHRHALRARRWARRSWGAVDTHVLPAVVHG
jgi:hypothetical protein